MQVLFYPYQLLPLRARVDKGAMAMKGFFAILKALASLETHHQIVLCHILDSLEGFYPSAEKQLVYSIAPSDWAKKRIMLAS